MPNHCSNALTIVGEPSEVQAFLDVADEIRKATTEREVKVLNGMFPRPSSVPDDMWYGWNLENWGSKWGAYDEYWDEPFLTGDPEPRMVLDVRFTSAWCSPDLLIRNISLRFPTLRFGVAYEEWGMMFVGGYVYGCGHLEWEDYRGWDDIPKELQEACEADDYDPLMEWQNEQFCDVENDMSIAVMERD